MIGKLALVLDVVPEEEDRNDQERRNQARPQSVRIPHLGAGTHENRIDEREDGAEHDQNGRSTVWTFDMTAVDTMQPTGVEVQEVEDDVADVGDGQDEEETGRVGSGDGQNAKIDAEVSPHGTRGRAVRVDVAQITRQPAVDGALVERSRGSGHCGHDRQEQRQDHQHHHDVGDEA